MNFRIFLHVGVCVCAGLMLASTAQSAVTLPFGDTFLNGTLDFQYASSGAARIEPVLYVDSNENFGPGALATVYVPPGNVNAGTGLEFDYSFSGEGSSTLEVVYTVTNHTGLAWTGLRFFADVSGDTFDTLLEIPKVNSGVPAAGDPDNWGVDDFFSGDLFFTDILTNANLDGTDHCGGLACEAEGALQWNLATLNNAQTWMITVLLSDNGAINSNLSLQFELADAFGTALSPLETLSISGQAAVVPLPGGLILLLSVLPALGFARRKSWLARL